VELDCGVYGTAEVAYNVLTFLSYTLFTTVVGQKYLLSSLFTSSIETSFHILTVDYSLWPGDVLENILLMKIGRLHGQTQTRNITKKHGAVFITLDPRRTELLGKQHTEDIPCTRNPYGIYYLSEVSNILNVCYSFSAQAYRPYCSFDPHSFFIIDSHPTTLDAHGSSPDHSTLFNPEPGFESPVWMSPSIGTTHTPVAESEIWLQLQEIGSEIDKWRFMAKYDRLPEIVWDIWNLGSETIFQQILHEEMARGDRYMGWLLAILPHTLEGVLDVKEWMPEFSELLAKIHRAMAALGVRLELVDNGSVESYSKLLRPRYS
jgi:hypothetical protein